MTKEELKQKAEVCMHNALFWLKLPISKENVEKGSSYIFELLEPREKRIAELEAQIEKMKCCENCAWWYRLPNGERDCAEVCGNFENWSLRRKK